MTLFTHKTKVFVSIIAPIFVILLGSISNLTSTFAEQNSFSVSSTPSPYDFCVEPGQPNLARAPICDHSVPTPIIIYNPCFYPVQSSNPVPSSCVYTSNSAPCYSSSAPLPHCQSSSNSSSVISSSSSITSNSSSSDKNPKSSSSSSNSTQNSSSQSYYPTPTSSSKSSQNSTIPASTSSSLPASSNSSTSSSISSIQGVLDYSASSNSGPQGGGGLLAQTGTNITLLALALFSILSFIIMLVSLRAQSQT